MSLAARRSIGGGLAETVPTPLLVPSFSSKAGVGWTVQDAVEQMAQQIVETALVSLFDVGTGLLDPPEFPKLLFVDSGGYEMHRALSAVEEYGAPREELDEWNREAYVRAVGRLSLDVATVVVSYDHPNDLRSIEAQIADAPMTHSSGMAGELLIKAPAGRPQLRFEDLEPHVEDLARFPIVGLTDKEIGRTLDRRLSLIARLRRALSARGHQTPLHIFGSLDPVTAPLYFIAGADVFDGLSWQRYALDEKGATYLQSHIAASGMSALSYEGAQMRTWIENLVQLNRLQERMRAFLADRDFSVFGAHAEMLMVKSRWLAGEAGG